MPATIERQQSSTEIAFRRIAKLTKTRINDSEEYWKLRGEGIPHPESFRQTADMVAGDETNELSVADRSLLSVVGNLGVFVQAQARLNEIEENRDLHLSTQEYKEVRGLKDEFIIPFNHILKEYVNTHPDEELRAISSALTNTYEKIFSRFDCLDPANEGGATILQPDAVFQRIQASLDGMRHEVAAETILEAADYVFEYNVTTKEDAEGSDLFVYLESGWEGVDIKASLTGVKNSQAKNRYSRAVVTGLAWEDFTGSKGTGRGTLSIPFSVAESKAPAFIANIREMVQRNNDQRQAASRRTGKQTLTSYR